MVLGGNHGSRHWEVNFFCRPDRTSGPWISNNAIPTTLLLDFDWCSALFSKPRKPLASLKFSLVRGALNMGVGRGDSVLGVATVAAVDDKDGVDSEV
jgi:hypothetical protein